MIDFYKYLPVSQEDEDWGLSVLNAGRTHIESSTEYPAQNHPDHHRFNWKNWRILDEYQVIYITGGQGVFESESCNEIEVKAGSIILLFPKEKHRYRPNANTGWDEHWVGLRGNILDGLVNSGYLNPASACSYIGFNDEVLSLYNSIIDNIKAERPGYQPLVSGAVLHLIGMCHAILKRSANANKDEETIIDKARLLFRSNICNVYSAHQAAKELNVGYSWFRKLFKSYTGLSPGQYYIQLKIEKAKELLRNENASIKSISFELNFQSSFYFSKIFKEKAGLNPRQFRKTIAVNTKN